jgi:hypothetical protein
VKSSPKDMIIVMRVTTFTSYRSITSPGGPPVQHCICSAGQSFKKRTNKLISRLLNLCSVLVHELLAVQHCDFQSSNLSQQLQAPPYLSALLDYRAEWRIRLLKDIGVYNYHRFSRSVLPNGTLPPQAAAFSLPSRAP